MKTVRAHTKESMCLGSSWILFGQLKNACFYSLLWLLYSILRYFYCELQHICTSHIGEILKIAHPLLSCGDLLKSISHSISKPKKREREIKRKAVREQFWMALVFGRYFRFLQNTKHKINHICNQQKWTQTKNHSSNEITTRINVATWWNWK